MNPVIVIPSYWGPDNPCNKDGRVPYDHTTPLSAEHPELEDCLSSLDDVRGVMRVVILLVADSECEQQARERVEAICKRHLGLNPLIIGSKEARRIQDATTNISPEMQGETISLRGYGGIKNMGLIVAAILGHDVCVFLDDDEICLDADFLVEACYGLGRTTRQGLPLMAKSGYYLRRDRSPFADDTKIAWYDKKWSKTKNFNAWLSGALSGTRISRSNILCGGCMAIHAEAFTQVAFDPWISRGEDLDYLINLRLCGLDAWFDNKWRVCHMPPETESKPSRFAQDIYRWIYEAHKLDLAKSQIRLRPVTSRSLEPYPGEWVSTEKVEEKIAWSANARVWGCKEHLSYLKIRRYTIEAAQKYAEQNGYRYFSFMSFWPKITSSLWNQEALAQELIAGQTFNDDEADTNDQKQ